MPVHARIRHLGCKPCGERFLCRSERVEVRRRPRSVEVERAPLDEGKRRLRERHDDFDERPAGARLCGRAAARQDRQQGGGKDEEAEGWAAQARMVRAIPAGLH
jgi:hypothetical protein